MSDNQIQYLTPDGLVEIETKLETLRTIRRPEIAEKLHQTIEDGGKLSENVAYRDVKAEQAFVEGEILRLECILSDAKIIDNSSPPNIVGLGDKVQIQQKKQKELEVYQIVGAAEADPAEGRISNESPLGSALMGHCVGDSVTVNAPESILLFTIKAIFT